MNEKGQPLISVITPTYNAEKYIEETIRSVQKQTYQEWEMIIVDDCSTDQTLRIIKEFANLDSRIKVYKQKKNQGAGHARNKALSISDGRFVAFLDSDDQWRPNKLEKQLKFMLDNNYAFTYTGYDRLQLNDQGALETKTVHVPKEATYHKLLKKNVIGCLTVMIDRNQTGPIQMLDIRRRQDYALWLELTRTGFKAYGLTDSLALYRVRVDSISSNKLSVAKQNWRVYREVEKLSLPVAIWYFMHYAVLKTLEYINY